MVDTIKRFKVWMEEAFQRQSATVWVAVGAAFLTACSGDIDAPREALPAAPSEMADIIFLGDHILPMDGSEIEGVAVLGDTILATGTEEEIRAYHGEETRLIELGDRALLPGFVDAHSHVMGVAAFVDLTNVSSPPVGPVETMDDLIETLRGRIDSDRIPAGERVIGYGYDDSLIAENRHPTRDDLDKVSTEHPVALLHVSGHLATANSLALAQAGLTAQSEDPPGGHIRREKDGVTPNGVLEETATAAVLGGVFQPDPSKFALNFGKALDVYASEGFTTVQDGASSLPAIAGVRAIAAQAPFKVDVVMFPHAGQITECIAESLYETKYTNGLRLGGVKFILDGSPQGRTAFLTRPYTLPPEGKGEDYVAYPTMFPEAANALSAQCIENGVPMLMHANGDAAIDIALNAIDLATDDETMPDHRTVIIHGQLMREDQLDRVKQLRMVPSYYAAHPFFWGDWHRVIFGDDRALRISPIHSTVERDIPFTIHNDAPVIPPMGMRLVDIAVNRKTRAGFVLGEEQRATPYQALYAMTMGGAYQYFEEDQKGSITPGKKADLIILEVNPLTVDPDTLKDVQVVETFSGGISVYTR